MSDTTMRAKALLESMPPAPWQFDPNQDDLLTDGNGHVIPPVIPVTEFIAAARTLVPELIAEVEQLREGVAAIEHFARTQTLSDRVRSGPNRFGYDSEEKYWLDLLAIIERLQGTIQ